MLRNTILVPCDYFFFLYGADGMVGALAAILFHVVTFMMKASIREVEHRERRLLSYVILNFLLLYCREI